MIPTVNWGDESTFDFCFEGIEKGGGSTYGGKWKPTQAKGSRPSGTPGEIKVTYSQKGEKTETLIGDDGMAIKEIHYSTHGNGDIHDNPHGHIITYDPATGFPDWSDPINGIGHDFLKCFIRRDVMPSVIYDTSTPEENRFKTISDFKWSMKVEHETRYRSHIYMGWSRIWNFPCSR